MVHHYLPIFLIVLGAAIVPFIARRMRVPSAALEIVYGLLLFNFILDERPGWFPLFRELGLVYLMFIAGMELDLRSLWRGGRAGWYVLVSVVSFTLTPLLFVALGLPFFLGVAVAMISAGIVVPVLKETGLMKTPLGQKIMGVVLTGELLSIMVLALIDAYHKHGMTWLAATDLLKLTLVFALAVVVLKAMRLLAWWYPARVQKVMESEDPVEEGVRIVVTVAFAGGLLAILVGAEAILGSFLMGVVFTFVFRNKGRFEEKINALGFGFLIPFFFIGVGSDLTLDVLTSWDTVLLAVFLTLAVLVSNLSPLLVARPLGLTLREAAAMAILLSAPLTMIVVAGTMGERIGVLSPEMTGPLVLTALLASLLYPSLFRPLAQKVASEEQGENKSK
jgi:Kef-type K+ transport system membrane component KefB